MKKLSQIAQDEAFAVATIINEFTTLFKAHKRKFLLFMLFELWVHGLAVHHLSELKSLMELIPFLHP